jgi:energy-coupling factor transporter ATP-binding protein EcfA2
VLFRVSLTIAACEMVSLLGRNGTGQTTTVRSSGRTKCNRARLGIPKTHVFDAACVGDVGTLVGAQIPTLATKAPGRGCYCRTKLTAHGFPRGHGMRAKSIDGFKTGDRVRADVSKGKKAGTYLGRVAVRASGSFNVQTPTGVVQGINARHCTILHRADGYKYHQQRAALLLPAVLAPISDDFG